MVAVRENDLGGALSALEPLEALGRHAGVDQDPLAGEVVRADLDAPPLVGGGPVPDAGEDLAQTPLQVRLARLGRQLALAVVLICAIVFATGTEELQKMPAGAVLPPGALFPGSPLAEVASEWETAARRTIPPALHRHRAGRSARQFHSARHSDRPR